MLRAAIIAISGSVLFRAAGTLSFGFASVPSPKPAKWVELFNGKDLTGWEGSRGVWQVKDGMIFATTFPTGRRQNTFLCLKGTYRDFELEFDVRVGGSNNSGVMFRSELLDRENYWLNGV